MNTLYIVNSEDDAVIAWAEVNDDEIKDLCAESAVKLYVEVGGEIIDYCCFGNFYVYTEDEINKLGWDTETAIYVAESIKDENSFLLTLV